jgi:hypothetical protein
LKSAAVGAFAQGDAFFIVMIEGASATCADACATQNDAITPMVARQISWRTDTFIIVEHPGQWDSDRTSTISTQYTR